MDVLTKKQYREYEYLSRYTIFPYYYHTRDDKYVYGLTNHLRTDTAFVMHEVRDNDTLDLLAFKYYGRPDYFWIIADFNQIRDPLINLKEHFKSLKVPSISTITYRD